MKKPALVMLAAVAVGTSSASAEPAPHPARDGRFVEIGLGSPGGMTFAGGIDTGPWRARGEVGGLVMGPAGLVSAGAHLHRDLVVGDRAALSGGLTASASWFFVGAADGTASGNLLSLGPTVQLRRTMTRRTGLALDAGALLGRCEGAGGECDGSRYVMIAATARLVVAL